MKHTCNIVCHVYFNEEEGEEVEGEGEGEGGGGGGGRGEGEEEEEAVHLYEYEFWRPHIAHLGVALIHLPSNPKDYQF